MHVFGPVTGGDLETMPHELFKRCWPLGLLNQDTSHMYFLVLYFWEAKEISYKTTAEATAKTFTIKESESVSRSVLSDSMRSHGL